MEWSKRDGLFHKTKYESNETYLSSKIYVIGDIGIEKSVKLKPGIQEFNFSFGLPHDLPSSIAGKHGEVRYAVLVTIENSMEILQNFQNSFKVIRPRDLNLTPQLANPIQLEYEMTLNTCFIFCCCDGPAEIKMKAPSSGFATGHKLFFNFHIRHTIYRAHFFEGKLQLIKAITYTARTPDKKQIQNRLFCIQTH